MIAKVSKLLKEFFLLGLLSVAPLAITAWIFIQGFKIIDNFFPEKMKAFDGVGILFFFAIILLAGVLTKTVLGKLFNSASDAILTRLPLVRGIYALIKQVSHALLSNDSKSSFKKVVYISFFAEDCKLLAFVTGELPEKNMLVLFVPTAPNPTSGYTVMFPKEKVEESDMSVEEAVKVIVSCGSALNPKQLNKAKEKPL